MSLATIIAIVTAFGLFIGAILISTDNVTVFLSLSSFIMVFGGTMSAMFISYEPRYVLLSLKLITKIFFAPAMGRDLLKAEVGRIIKWAYAVQKNGTPALEQEAKKAIKGDRFMKFGVEMVISGYTGAEVREILTNTVETTFGRNTVPVFILKDMAAGAPAFGMVGTLVGLVVMLNSMGGDPSQLGAGLAVAMITTLYGVFFARVIFMPAASKVMQREQIVKFRNYLVLEGLCMLADRKSPRFIQDKMNSYLDPAIHFDIDKMKK
jgi:chemotaxis protein MotA